MQGSLEHQSPQFAVNTTFESFSALKLACIRAALLDIYEFDPVKVDSGQYTLKCKDKECSWYLHATSVGETDTWKIRTLIQQHTCHGLIHDGHCNIDEEFISIEILPQVRSNSSVKPDVIKFLWRAASATTQPIFDKALADMATIDPKSVPWLLSHANPEHWAELYFPGCRYGHLTSNIAESLNSWILKARKKPILAMFESMYEYSDPNQT